QQRILLAGAISAGRSTLLLDEPCSAMDPPTRSLVLELLLQLRSKGISICLTSHDWGRALLSYDRVIVLDRTVLFDGAPTGIDQALDDLMASRHRCNH
ncbi:MAG: ABC transporter ATP-binding protein, partial [Synechococcus sp.]|nr:ABC transporter ATP-binding protein [Synechococcus sp.]